MANLLHLIITVFLTTAVHAVLDKPYLRPDLNDLGDGLYQNLPSTPSSWEPWGEGWIPYDCAYWTRRENRQPRDMRIFNVWYSDCPDPWTFCMHKDSPMDIGAMADRFGRVPVGMRDWTRHVMSFDNSIFGPGYAWAGSVAFNGTWATVPAIWLHEIAHGMDEQGAFGEKPFSTAGVWLENYNQDSHVVDWYAQYDQAENVAQVTVISIYDKIVSGGFGSREPNWNAVFHQYATAQWKAGTQIIPAGPGGRCNRRLRSSTIISMDAPTNENPSPDQGRGITQSPGLEREETPFANEENYDIVETSWTSVSPVGSCRFGKELLA